MVSLSVVRASNSLIPNVLPAGLVAIFVGGTSGIGEMSVKAFAKSARKPRVYIAGRSRDAADRIVAECKALNAEGEFTFLQADVSLIRNVDKLCKEIKTKEKSLNLLFLSAGVARFDGSKTSENLHLLAALNYYSRVRLIQNLLPLIQQAVSLRRIVSVGGGGFEGSIDPTDFQALRAQPTELRERLTTLVTLGLEAIAKTAPEVSFIHDYPGTVETPLLDHIPREQFKEMLKNLVFVPHDECAERHLFLATSDRYPPASGNSSGVPLAEGLDVALGSSGEVGSGMYSIGADCESGSPTVREKLAALRGKGMVDQVWHHTEEEFRRITQEAGSF